MGHRVLVGTPEYMADELEAWLKQDAADGFNVICNHYPKPLEDFCTMVVPELQRRGVFRRDYSGRTLREHFGLRDAAEPLRYQSGRLSARRRSRGAGHCSRRRAPVEATA